MLHTLCSPVRWSAGSHPMCDASPRDSRPGGAPRGRGRVCERLRSSGDRSHYGPPQCAGPRARGLSAAAGAVAVPFLRRTALGVIGVCEPSRCKPSHPANRPCLVCGAVRMMWHVAAVRMRLLPLRFGRFAPAQMALRTLICDATRRVLQRKCPTNDPT